MSSIKWQDNEYEKESALEQQNREEIDKIYAPLNMINSKASPELIQALRNPGLKQKRSQQQSSKRRRASSESADKATVNQTKRIKSSLKATSNSVQKQKPSQQQSPRRRRTANTSANEVTKRAKRLNSNLEYLSIIDDLKNWEHLSDNEFCTRRFRLWEILDLENARRQLQGPDGSYNGKQETDTCKINGYPVRYTLQRFTDWQFHFFYIFWIEEHRRIVKLRMARNRLRDCKET